MVKVDFSRKAGKIKPLHGINNGPLSSECVTDTSKYYKIGIPLVRLMTRIGLPLNWLIYQDIS